MQSRFNSQDVSGGAHLTEISVVSEGLSADAHAAFLERRAIKGVGEGRDQRHRLVRERCGNRAGHLCRLPQRREELFFLLGPDQEHLPEEQFDGRKSLSCASSLSNGSGYSR